MDILQRILLTLALISAAFVIYRWANRWLLSRNRDKIQGLDIFQRGVPGILYFTSPDCTPCITVQRPELARVKAELGEAVQIITVDCQAQPDLASHWGVLTVPTTFLIDPDGQPRGVNHGVTRAVKLIRQLSTLPPQPPSSKRTFTKKHPVPKDAQAL